MSSSNRKGFSLPPQWLLPALAALAVLVRWLFFGATGLAFEDSFISLRYAENLAAGHGMVYNPGERVFGASTPLYVLLLAGFVKAGLPALLLAKALTSLADGVTLYLWGRWLQREGRPTPALLFFGLVFILWPFLVQVSVSGMETSFALLLLSLLLLGDLEDRPAALGWSAGLLILVRPDGALAVAIVLGLRWWRTRRLPWGPALLAGGLLLPWILAATWYYGSPIPHSIPAKVAAYNIHRPSILPNFVDTLAQVAPVRGPWPRFLATFLFFPSLLLGGAAAWREPRLRPLVVLFLAWWVYLVLPRTLLFTWYYPLLLLPACVLAALGFPSLCERLSRLATSLRHASQAPHTHTPPETAPLSGAGTHLHTHTPTLALLTLALVAWLGWTASRVALVQRAERSVRRQIGEWLRSHTPEGARIAMEPIGYIGYYSKRRVLDEVGLVSPEMVPLNRSGTGWFPRMLREFRPEYVVERPGYLLRNRTLNSGVPMFGSADEMREFIAAYEPVAAFTSTDVPKHLIHDYRFVVYARRAPDEARRWRKRWSALSPPEREELLVRSITGPAAASRRAQERAAPPRP